LRNGDLSEIVRELGEIAFKRKRRARATDINCLFYWLLERLEIPTRGLEERKTENFEIGGELYQSRLSPVFIGFSIDPEGWILFGLFEQRRYRKLRFRTPETALSH
jgi:hypothetical protein